MEGQKINVNNVKHLSDVKEPKSEAPEQVFAIKEFIFSPCCIYIYIYRVGVNVQREEQ